MHKKWFELKKISKNHKKAVCLKQDFAAMMMKKQEKTGTKGEKIKKRRQSKTHFSALPMKKNT